MFKRRSGPAILLSSLLALSVPAVAVPVTAGTLDAKPKAKKTARPQATKTSDKATRDAAKAAREADKASANAPGAPPPPNATAQCQDGTYTTSKQRQSACASHGGVGTWLGEVSDTAAGRKR
jgi:hypothetical protein